MILFSIFASENHLTKNKKTEKSTHDFGQLVMAKIYKPFNKYASNYKAF